MLPIRWALVALVTTLFAGSAPAAESVALVDAATDVPADGSVQVRTLGSKSVWMVAPGGSLPDVGERIEVGDDEDLYLVRDHGARETGRTLARWDGYRIVAIRTDADDAAFHHCAERVGWLRPAPRPDERAELARRTSPSQKAKVIDAIDAGRYEEILRRLSGDLPTAGFDTIATRWTYSDGLPRGIDLATDYIVSRFESFGYEVVEQDFAMPVTTRFAKNLIAVREGAIFPNEVVVVGAHYDSITDVFNEDSAVGAPGAEDNASGTAAVLELARAFAHVVPERTIHFIAFSGEEQGLRGSRHYVDELATNGWTVVGAYTMDMIAAWEDDYGILIEGNNASTSLMNTLNANTLDLGVLSTDFSFNPFGSDHVPFLQAGIPALLAIDLDWAQYDPYHSQDDTFDKTDPTLGYHVTRAIAGAVIDLAGTVNVVSVDDGDLPLPVGTPALALAPPFPNPFNPRTVIAFEVPTEGPVSLSVYDARGRIVRRLVDGHVSPGRGDVVWDGEDEEGQAVASGMYFVRLEHAERMLTRRAVLVR